MYQLVRTYMTVVLHRTTIHMQFKILSLSIFFYFINFYFFHQNNKTESNIHLMYFIWERITILFPSLKKSTYGMKNKHLSSVSWQFSMISNASLLHSKINQEKKKREKKEIPGLKLELYAYVNRYAQNTLSAVIHYINRRFFGQENRNTLALHFTCIFQLFFFVFLS